MVVFEGLLGAYTHDETQRRSSPSSESRPNGGECGLSPPLAPRQLPGGACPWRPPSRTTAMRALTTLVMPSPTPAAAAHSRASGHENRGSGGVEGRQREPCSLRRARYDGPDELPGKQPTQQAGADERRASISQLRG